jgi:hypothetical protein
MFQAIVHGKVRDNLAGVKLGAEWRSVYRHTEDFLTAAVFARLTYLPSHTLWSILRHAAVTVPPSHPLPHDVGRLVTREFWPRWELDTPQQDTTWKEPDVFLGFERLHLLVEAKLGDFPSQYAEQWAAEHAAFLQRDETAHAIPVWLLAIGGMGEIPTSSLTASMQQEAERLLHDVFHYPNTSVRLAACSWRSLLGALVEERRQADPQSGIGLDFIMADLMQILDFHGIRDTHWLGDLLRSEVKSLRTIGEGSLEKLGAWALSTRPAVFAEHASWLSVPELRGIREESMVIMGEIVDGQPNR